MTSPVPSVKTNSTDHIRLLITLEDVDLVTSTSEIPSQRFVFGVDVNLRPSIKDVLADLHSKLASKREDVRLELYLRTAAEYFLPPWSITRDVLQQNDEVILRLREIRTKDKCKKNEDHADTMAKTEKKKRKLEESLDGTVGAVADATTNDDDPKLVKERPKDKKKKKKHRSPSQNSAFVPVDQAVGDSTTDQSSSVVVPSVAQSKTANESPTEDRGRKKQKVATSGDVYDNAIVIRNGNTGKIQHVYFDSSPSPPSSDGSTTQKQSPVKVGKQTAVVESQQETPVVKSDKEKSATESGKVTERLTSKALAKAKKFSASLDQTTTCEDLGKTFRFGSSLDVDRNLSTSIQSATTAVVVTKNQTKPKGGANRYSNVSLLVEKSDSPTASSTPVQDNGAQRNKSKLVASTDQGTVITNGVKSQSSPDQTSGSHSARSPRLTQSTLNGTEMHQGPSVDSWAPSRPIVECPPIKHPSALRIGDLLAYKVMELNELDCTPGISDWKIGRLEAFDAEELELTIKLITGEARCDVPLKFRFVEEDELNGEEEWEVQADQSDRTQKKLEDVVFWREIVEARFLNN